MSRVRRVSRVRAAISLGAFVTLLTACENLVTRPTPYGTVRVRAMTRDSVPLPGIGVELYTGFRPMGYSVTDARGRTTFTLVPRAQYGVLMKLPSQYARLNELLAAPPGDVVDGLEIDTRTDTLLTFVFARRGPGTIEALVVDQDTLPVQGLIVSRYDPAGIQGQSFTDESGIARFHSVPFGQHGVVVNLPDTLGIPGGQAVWADGLAIEQDVTVRPRLVISRCEGTVRVTVRDQANAPIAGIAVQLFRVAGVARTVATDATGLAIFFRVWCDNWGVLLSPTPGFSVTYTNGLGVADGIVITHRSTVAVTLRATTTP